MAHICKHNNHFSKYNTVTVLLKHNKAIVETQHSIIEAQHNIIETQHRIIETQHNIIETQHCMIETQHNVIETQHSIIQTQHNVTLKHNSVFGKHNANQPKHNTIFAKYYVMQDVTIQTTSFPGSFLYFESTFCRFFFCVLLCFFCINKIVLQFTNTHIAKILVVFRMFLVFWRSGPK